MERKAKAMAYLKAKRENALGADQDAQLQALKDPNSVQSKARKQMAQKYGVQVTPEMSGFDVDQMLDSKKMLEAEAQASVNFGNNLKMEEIRHKNDMQKYGAEIGIRRADKATEKAEKLEKDRKDRTTTYGVARTDDDAKKLKDVAELKQSFDTKLEEMIALRKKHDGGAIFNRDDVNRGKALSDDLLLAYKDLSKLGVMSKTDENILRRIIPSDPLQYNSPIAAVQGQDPTMNQMSKFKEDSERDFQTRLKNRLEDYSPDRKIAKQERNKKTGEVRVTYSDGTTEIIPRTAGR
jgi:hypothetical protein